MVVAHAGRLLPWLLAVTLLTGCLPATLVERDDSKTEVEADFEFPVRVAVLPFANGTEEPAASDIVRRLFFNFFSSLNYRDKELFSIDRILKAEGLYKQVASGKEYSLSRVCSALDVDAVISGEVVGFGKLFAVVYAQREVALKAQFRQCSTGKLLWSREDKATERDGSLFSDVTALFLTVVETYVSHHRASSIENSARLCLRMVESIPNPIEVSEPPPRIRQMVHNGIDRIIRPGEALRAVLIGDAGLMASWDISREIRDLPLTEKSPGIYIGEYIVQEGDRVVNGHIDGHLTSEAGVTAHWMDAVDGIFIGNPTRPPLVITEDSSFAPEESPYLIEELLLVKPGVTLNIAPGTIILLQKAGIVVQGRLVARGEDKHPILLAGLGGNSWKGVLLYGGTGRSLVRHVTIRDAKYGVKARASAIEIDKSAFLENSWGVVVESGSSLHMMGSLVRGSKSAGLSARNSEVIVSASHISGNIGGGIQVLDSKLEMQDSDIYGNGPWELRNHDANSVLKIENNWWGAVAPGEVATVGVVELGVMRKEPATSVNIHGAHGRR